MGSVGVWQGAGPNPKLIAEVGTRASDVEQSFADARLIATAPRLYEALHDAVDIIADLVDRGAALTADEGRRVEGCEALLNEIISGEIKAA